VSEGASAQPAGDDAGGLEAEVARLRGEVARLREELEGCRRLFSQSVEAEEAGRRRIAQLIHDDALQSLLAAHQDLLEAAPGRAGVTRAHEVVGGAIARLREALLVLHPVTLEEGGFEHALGAVARWAERQGGFEVSVALDADALGVQDELLMAVARELLANAAKHSRATRVEVALHRDDDRLELEVRDDGRGIAPGRREEALAEGHVGLAAASQRVRSAGGSLEVEGSDAGTTARVSLPAAT
jgi:two-component system, NarL family, sensor kinase